MPQAEMPCSPSVTWTVPGPDVEANALLEHERIIRKALILPHVLGYQQPREFSEAERLRLQETADELMAELEGRATAKLPAAPQFDNRP